MGKIKRHKSVSKRFNITKHRKLLHDVPGASHLMVKKNTRMKNRKKLRRQLSKTAVSTIIKGII
ncbi:MAG: hypothetical protein KatS3mg084_0541 [Candidatus Dojkabacteria bacterium]|nr:MAG: hypothetical protein KatS3mg084_0541 [Candidatus Dojkabacteria bacterium]